ncbi:hypothetical protein KDA23_04085, partial [Candidatus Saccharibacteria bacterium]|nr:hypothetical protein [Candidatus Saccharibacteria bacterium]
FTQTVPDVKTNELPPLDFSMASINKCGSQYVLNTHTTNKALYANFIFLDDEGVSMELYCSMNAKAEYFPLVNEQ